MLLSLIYELYVLYTDISWGTFTMQTMHTDKLYNNIDFCRDSKEWSYRKINLLVDREIT